jgi:serine/threonine-protein kinase
MLVCPRCHANLPPNPGPWCDQCGAEEPMRGWPDDPLIGRTLAGRYVVARRIGAGGMGAVYRASDPDGWPVAVKTLHAHLSDSAEMARRFRREARVAGHLRGPHSVRVYDAGELGDGTLFFVMELVEGESLSQRLARRGALPAGEAVALFGQLARALDEAHALGLVHRDLKPENLLIVRDGGGETLKVLDFGIVKVLDARIGTVGHTADGAVFGTPEFMSPEQARGAADVDARSDVYSAGLCLFLMLTGRMAFSGTTPQEIMLRRLIVDPPRLGDVRPDLLFPMGLEAVVERLLARRPEDRYAAMGEALRDLEAVAPPSIGPVPDTAPVGGFAPPPVVVSPVAPTLPAEPPPYTPAPTAKPARSWTLALMAAGFLGVMSLVAWLLSA